jgi:hypothetical protein
MPNRDRLMTAAATLLSAGLTLVGSWLGYVAVVDKASFWDWPGFVGVGLCTIGSIGVLMGLFAPEARLSRSASVGLAQRQRGGSNSVNVQIGKIESHKPPPKRTS